MRYRYYFADRYNQRLVDFLEKNNIDHKIKTYEKLDSSWIYFNIYSTTKNVEKYLQELKEIFWGDPLVFVEYTAEELANAKLLVMRPHLQSVDICNEEEAYIYRCTWKNRWGEMLYKHEEQVGVLRVKKEPSMKTKTAFWCESTGFAEVFTDFRVSKLIQDNSLSGIELKQVKMTKDKYSEKLYQITSPNIISKDCIELGHGEEVEKCKICGKEQYFIDDIYQLHLEFSKIEGESDLNITERIWGQGIAYPLYIISQRFYQLLKQNKLDGKISFSPIIDVSNIQE